jgi:hypothetical protein
MPIKWNALEVSEAMDEVEKQLALAETFLAEAEQRAGRAGCQPNLPEYMRQRISRLAFTIHRREEMKQAVEAVRTAIPHGAIEAEQGRMRQGRQQTLISSRRQLLMTRRGNYAQHLERKGVME